MAGKEPGKMRPLVGRWLKLCGDDAQALIDAIGQAERRRIADPIAWIEAALKPRGGEETTLQQFLRSLANV